MGHALDRVVLAVGKGNQCLEGIVHLPLGNDPVSPGGIVAGLGLQDVGLVREAYVETLIGLIQLTLERRFFSLARRQAILGAQHGKVILRALQYDILLGRRQLQGCLLVHCFGGLQLEPAVGAEHRLCQGRLPGNAAAGGSQRRVVELGPRIERIGAAGEVWQQAGTGLGHDFLLRGVVGAGCGEVGVVVHSLLVDADQIGFR
ncbi:hypothetical protein D9M73_163230 [compost metagenome]